MKKFLLFAAAALMATSASADWYLCGNGVNGNMNQWSDNAKYKFEATSDPNVFTFHVNELKGQMKVKEKGTWSTSFGSNGAKLQEGTLYRANKDGGNIAIDGIITDADVTINVSDYTILVKGKTAENDYSEVYLVGDFGSGWNEGNTNYPLTLKAGTENVYTGTYTLTAGSTYFKMKAGALVYGTGGANINVNLGQSYTGIQSGDSFVLPAGEYVFTYTLDKNAETGTLVVTGKAIPYETLYIIGQVNGAGWSSDNGIALTKGENGVFTATDILIGNAGDGVGYFSFSEKLCATWDELNTGRRLGATEGDTPVELGTQLPIQSGENSFKIASDKNYNFTVDTENMTLVVEEVVAPTPIVIVVKTDGEGTLTYDADFHEISGKINSDKNEVTITVEIPAGYNEMYYQIDNGGGVDQEPVKVRRAPEGDNWIAAADLLAAGFVKGNELTVKTGDTLVAGLFFGLDGKVDQETMTRVEVETVKDNNTGVDAIEAAEAEAEYYNLQGVRVANPENGIFVKVVAGKAVKVVK